MIVKTVALRRHPIGDQVRWYSDIDHAMIVEQVEEPSPTGFVSLDYVGTIATAEERELAERKTIGVPLPRTTWLVVWLNKTDGSMLAINFGNDAQGFLMNDEGKTIDRLI